MVQAPREAMICVLVRTLKCTWVWRVFDVELPEIRGTHAEM